MLGTEKGLNCIMNISNIKNNKFLKLPCLKYVTLIIIQYNNL